VPEAIRPFARALLLCDYVVGYENGKTDLYGLFNAIRPAAYPHTQGRFCLFAQLAGGLGEVPFHADVIFRPRDELVWTTEVRNLRFSNRDLVVQVALEVQGCPFPEPGPYLVELYCEAVCVADAPLLLMQGEKSDGSQAAGTDPGVDDRWPAPRAVLRDARDSPASGDACETARRPPCP
jgi:hypothetical protein